MIQNDRELLRLLPGVSRARDFHLYLESGKRLLDLWLLGGRAVLGHKPPKVLGELKNAAERGLFTPLPHPMERRFLKALGNLFPNRAFRVYQDKSSLQSALDKAGFTGPAALWRPFSGDQDCYAPPVFTPVLPWPLGPEALVLEKDMDASFPRGEIVPPVLLAPATRALHNLASKMSKPDRQKYFKLEKVLSEPNTLWRRRGIYLMLEKEMENDRYAALFRHFLEGGFLIPPSQAEPVILPAQMSDGEESKLAVLLALFQ